MTRRSRAAAEVSSWASSTTMRPRTPHGAAQRRGVVLEQIGGRGEHPGGVIGAVPAQRGHLVVLAQHLRGGDPLGPVVLAPRRCRSSGAWPCSTARIRRSRSSLRKPRYRARPSRRSSGHSGREHLPDACPARRSRRIASCSGPLSSRGRVAAQRRLGAQDAEAEGLPRASEGQRRRSPEPRRHLLSQRPCGSPRGGHDEALVRAGTLETASTTSSTARVDLPVPGPPRTRSTAAVESTTRRWDSSRHTSPTRCAGARRRMTTAGFHHELPTARRTDGPPTAPRVVWTRRMPLRPPTAQRTVGTGPAQRHTA